MGFGSEFRREKECEKKNISETKIQIILHLKTVEGSKSKTPMKKNDDGKIEV